MSVCLSVCLVVPPPLGCCATACQRNSISRNWRSIFSLFQMVSFLRIIHDSYWCTTYKSYTFLLFKTPLALLVCTTSGGDSSIDIDFSDLSFNTRNGILIFLLLCSAYAHNPIQLPCVARVASVVWLSNCMLLSRKVSGTHPTVVLFSLVSFPTMATILSM